MDDPPTTQRATDEERLLSLVEKWSVRSDQLAKSRGGDRGVAVEHGVAIGLRDCAADLAALIAPDDCAGGSGGVGVSEERLREMTDKADRPDESERSTDMDSSVERIIRSVRALGESISPYEEGTFIGHTGYWTELQQAVDAYEVTSPRPLTKCGVCDETHDYLAHVAVRAMAHALTRNGYGTKNTSGRDASHVVDDYNDALAYLDGDSEKPWNEHDFTERQP